ncbi:MAG: type II CAAX endopeptidase family protein [Bacillota bacterium]|nr:type II CAAX endopeptidase family protein [Bacillota bacterium]
MTENNSDNIYLTSMESHDHTENILKKPTIKQASILYSVSVILFMVLSNMIVKIPFGDYYIKGISAEIILVLIPPLVFLTYKKFDIKKVLRLNKISFMNIILIVCITAFSIPVVGMLNLANMLIIKLIFGSTNLPQIKIPDIITLIKGFIVIGMSAALCEEVLFRGVIMRGYEKLGKTKAILLTAFLFGLMHHDFQRLLGTFLLGVLMGFLVYRTNSIFGGMVAHFTNNSLVVIMTFVLGKLASMGKAAGLDAVGGSESDKGISQLLSMPKIQLITTLGVFSLMFICFLAALIALIYAFIKNTSEDVDNATERLSESKFKGLLWLIPGIAVIGIIYFVQGVSLAGVKIQFLTNIIKALGL